MSEDDFDKNALIQYRLDQARETLVDARVLYDNDRMTCKRCESGILCDVLCGFGIDGDRREIILKAHWSYCVL